jgi:hypothetical protein
MTFSVKQFLRPYTRNRRNSYCGGAGDGTRGKASHNIHDGLHGKGSKILEKLGQMH